MAIVLSHQRRDELLENLASLEASQTRPAAIIAFVNGSTDGTAEAVEEHFPDVEVIRSGENLGVAAARNRGWHYAEAHHVFDQLLFLDDDTLLAPDCIGHLVYAFDAYPETGVLGVKAFANREQSVLCSTGIRVNFCTGRIYDIGSGERDRGQYDEPREVDAVGGFAVAIRSAAFERLGGFDERFNPYGWEDVDFCLRARTSGMAVRYVPAAVVVHRGTKLGRGPRIDYERAKAINFPRLVVRHSSGLQKLCLCFAIPARALAVAIRMLASGNAAMISAQIGGFLKGIRPSRRSGDHPRMRD